MWWNCCWQPKISTKSDLTYIPMMSLNFRAIVWHWTTLLFIEGYPSFKMYVPYSVSDFNFTILYSRKYWKLVGFFLKKALVWSRSELRTRQFRKPRFRPTSTKMTLLQSLYHGVAKRTSTLILAIGVTAFGFERGRKENFFDKREARFSSSSDLSRNEA